MFKSALSADHRDSSNSESIPNLNYTQVIILLGVPGERKLFKIASERDELRKQEPSIKRLQGKLEAAKEGEAVSRRAWVSIIDRTLGVVI